MKNIYSFSENKSNWSDIINDVQNEKKKFHNETTIRTTNLLNLYIYNKEITIFVNYLHDINKFLNYIERLEATTAYIFIIVKQYDNIWSYALESLKNNTENRAFISRMLTEYKNDIESDKKLELKVTFMYNKNPEFHISDLEESGFKQTVIITDKRKEFFELKSQSATEIGALFGNEENQYIKIITKKNVNETIKYTQAKKKIYKNNNN